MARVLLSIFLIFSVLPVYAQIYKCTKEGKIVFTDSPCHESMKQVEMQINTPSQVRPQEGGDMQPESNKKSLADRVNNATEKRLIKNEIDRKESRIRYLTKEMNEKLDALRNKKRYAANNLAGATWEKSISEEMSVVSTGYNSQIDGIRQEINRLRIQQDGLGESF